MTGGTLTARFLEEEVDKHVAELVLRLVRTREFGAEYLTFNVFNLRLDFDLQLATIEDELDPGQVEQLSLGDLTALLESR